MTTSLKPSKAARNYINSLLQQKKIFTINTILNQFPSENSTSVSSYLAAEMNTAHYTQITGPVVYISRDIFKNDASKEEVTLKARRSTVSSEKMINLPLNPMIVEKFKLSTRPYRFTVKNNTVTIHRSSQNKKLDSFNVWKTNRAAIPVPTLGTYNLIVK